jgi:hypothetical protein
MLKSIFTLDYEIHGNGDGCPYALMVEPTARMLKQFDLYGAKLTILADIAEILKFREYARTHGQDDFHYVEIADQLREAIRRGHDVQLHLHSSYFNARYEDGRWVQDWSEYNFAGLKPERLREVIRIGRNFLESLLRPVNPNYRCNVFRAANWSVSPSANVVRALVDEGFVIDTSVFKYGKRSGLVNFDYTNAFSSLIPWQARVENICESDPDGKLFEFPIYAEERRIGAFVTPQRIYRACVSRLHRFSGSRPALPAQPQTQSARTGPGKGGWLRRKHSWKEDFNQCGGGQLIAALKRAEKEFSGCSHDLPFVLIGHSKLFTRFNEWSLRPFLAFVANNPRRFGFARFSDFNLPVMRLPAAARSQRPGPLVEARA